MVINNSGQSKMALEGYKEPLKTAQEVKRFMERQKRTIPRKPSAANNGSGGAIRRTGKNKRTGLTQKQEAFCQGVIEGLTITDAYRNAYDVREGAKGRSHNTSAARLYANPSIQRRINELEAERDEQRRMQSRTMQARVVERLEKEAGDKSNPPAVRVRALELLGKTVGAFADVKVSVDAGEKTVEQLQDELIQLVKGEID